MTAQTWWNNAVLYQIDPAGFTPSTPIEHPKEHTTDQDKRSNLAGISQRIDYLHMLGVDAILLTPIKTAGATGQSIDPAYGSSDDMDDLVHQASLSGIRVLLTLDASSSSNDLTAAARFWLNHGVAGFHLIAASNSSSDIYRMQMGELRKVTNAYVGQRILIGDLNQSPTEEAPSKEAESRGKADPQLVFDPRAGTDASLSAAKMRSAIEAGQQLIQGGRGTPVLLTDGPEYGRSMSRYGDGKNDLAIAKALAAVLLTSRAGALLYYGQELGLVKTATSASVVGARGNGEPLIHWEAPPAPAKDGPVPPSSPLKNASNVALEEANPSSLLNWYRQLSALHHGDATLRSGIQIMLAPDVQSVGAQNVGAQNVLAWIRKPQAVSALSPALVVICNLSAQPVHLALKAQMQTLHLRGSFLRTVLRSDTGSGPMHLESLTISPFGVYIGELRY